VLSKHAGWKQAQVPSIFWAQRHPSDPPQGLTGSVPHGFPPQSQTGGGAVVVDVVVDGGGLPVDADARTVVMSGALQTSPAPTTAFLMRSRRDASVASSSAMMLPKLPVNRRSRTVCEERTALRHRRSRSRRDIVPPRHPPCLLPEF
jgi:hypothetical protein